MKRNFRIFTLILAGLICLATLTSCLASHAPADGEIGTNGSAGGVAEGGLGFEQQVPPHEQDSANIDAAVASEIKIAYCRFTCEKHYRGDRCFEPSDMCVMRYEGKIGACHIVMMGGDEIDYTDAERVEKIAGYTLLFGSGQPVYAYHDGGFYTIGEAYEAGLLSREDVHALSLIFRSYDSEDMPPLEEAE